MKFYSLKINFCYDLHSIFYTAVKVFFVIFSLNGIIDSQKVLAADFNTYLQRVRTEILINKEIILEDPLDAIAYFELGRTYLALGKHKEEVGAYQEAINLNPKYIEAHYNLSMAYDLLKDGPSAIKHMLRALNLSFEKRKHIQIRNVKRQLKRLYLKYPDKPSVLEIP
jgi:tetratricopeptide (TPR) repeat protein